MNAIHSAQSAIVRAVFGLRFLGSPLQRELAELRNTQWCTPEALEALQLKRLQQTLSHACKQVPYYRSLLSKMNLTPASFRALKDLQRLPVLEREVLQDDARTLVAEDIPQQKITKTGTGGSTGIPCTLFQTPEYIQLCRAVSLRCFEWANWRPGDGWVRIWGSDVDLAPSRKRRQRLANKLSRRMVVPAWELSEATMDTYARRLQHFGPRVIEGYATPLAFFAQFLIDNGYKDIHPHYVISSAETLFSAQRTAMEQAFGCPVLDRYGTREVGPISHECPEGAMHIQSEHVLVEFDVDGRPAAEGESGEILVTTLTNRVMPLIRYRIGDVGAPLSGHCPCGRGLPLMQKLSGRIQDLIVRPSGGHLAGEFFPHMLKDFDIRKYQVVQERIDLLIISLIPGPHFTSADRDRISEHTRRHLGPGVCIDIRAVEDIPLTRSGKHRSTISKVNGNPTVTQAPPTRSEEDSRT